MQFYNLILSHLEIFVQFNGEEENIINLLESIWKKETGIKIMSYKKGMKELWKVSLKDNIFSGHMCSVSFDYLKSCPI